MKHIESVLLQAEQLICEYLGLSIEDSMAHARLASKVRTSRHVESIALKDQRLESRSWQQLASGIAEIWEALNVGRQQRRSHSAGGSWANSSNHYLKSSSLSRAYLGGYSLPNIARTQLILNQPICRSALVTLLYECAKKHEPLHILDLGCGPLSASVGLLSVLLEIHEQKKLKVPLVDVVFHAVDPAQELRLYGEKLLGDILKKQSPNWAKAVQILGYKDLKEVSVAPSVILLANMLNENSVSGSKKILESIVRGSAAQSLLVCIEPGQDEHAKNLGSLRDHVLQFSQKEGFKLRILGPCLHTEPCPLSKEMNRPDWCWFRGAWRRPKLIERLDALTSLDHVKLNYSFLAALVDQKGSFTGFEKPPKNFARIVSDPILLPANEKNVNYFKSHLVSGNKALLTLQIGSGLAGGGVLVKELLCTYLGALEAALQGRAGAQGVEKRKLVSRRGGVVSHKNDVPLRASERSKSSLKSRDLERE